MIRRLVRLAADRDDERGIVLPIVIAIGAVLIILVSSMVALAGSGAIKSTNDSDSNNALAAAYAGLAAYQGKLTADNSYEQYGTASNFSGTSIYSTTDLTKDPAFGTGASGPWANVVDTGGTESYRYEVDNSDYPTSGQVRVRVTGRANNATRSIVADLRGDGFVNYLYFTNYESQEQSITGETTTTSSGASTTTPCSSYHRNDSQWNYYTSCKAVTFASGDTLSGPVRTNDVIAACGTIFKSTVQDTGDDGFFYTSKSPTVDNSCVAATKFQGGAVQNVGTLPMPATNANMKQETRYDIPTKVPSPGCMYTGPTSITFLGNGTMRVISPWTKQTQLSGSADGTITGGRSTGAAATQCGSISALHDLTNGAVIPTVPNNLVFVQNVPTSASDPNYTASNATPTGTVNSTISSGTAVFCNQNVKASRGNTTTATYGNGLGYPLSNEFLGATGAAGYYGCRNGDAFVQGGFEGQMTLASENFVYLTGNVTYDDGTDSDDMLGLVGQKAVTIYNPVSCSYTTDSGGTVCSTSRGYSSNLDATSNIEIDAAIASNLGTFNVQNNTLGSALGTLTLSGSIAQNWRGAVRTDYSSGYSTWSTGYTKNYKYDSRLRTSAPPKFLQPVSTTYGVTSEAETAPAWTATGVATGK